MPRVGAEPERRRSLIDAAVAIIGENGSLDVSVKEIAGRAGMSAALAFHYFGDKDEIITQTMRHLLREYARTVSEQLQGKVSAFSRLEAITNASFSERQFDRTTIAAWLVFYLRAYSSPSAARLLHVYTHRLRSNLVHAFSKEMDHEQAVLAAEMTASLIDGQYVRHALRAAGPNSGEAIQLCQDFLQQQFVLHRPDAH
ncbi:MAG: transcriptional regulator BetI [Rhizobiaceae bacterium]